LADLDRQHLHARHLLVEELHQPLQRGRDLIRHEDQPDLAFPQVRPDRVPGGGSDTLGGIIRGLKPHRQPFGGGLRIIALKPGTQPRRCPER